MQGCDERFWVTVDAVTAGMEKDGLSRHRGEAASAPHAGPCGGLAVPKISVTHSLRLISGLVSPPFRTMCKHDLRRRHDDPLKQDVHQ